MGDSSIFGCIPIEVVLARTISSSGQKLFNSERDKACPPTVSASSLARSCRKRMGKKFKICTDKKYQLLIKELQGAT